MFIRDRVLQYLGTVETATTEEICDALNLKSARVHEACTQLGDRVCKRTRSSAGGQNVWYLNRVHDNQVLEVPSPSTQPSASVKLLVEELKGVWLARQDLDRKEQEIMAKLGHLKDKVD